MSDWLGWHFLPNDRRMQYPPHTLVEAGTTYRATGTLELCANGMHACKRAIDALRYAPGDVVCRVRLSGERLDEDDKSCARERHVLWLADAGPVLHEFACAVAQRALDAERERGRIPDPRSYAAIAAKRAYLRGEIDAGELKAASAAASAAAWSAAAQDVELTRLLLTLAPKAKEAAQ